MSISAARLAANRANAQKSTGPKTDAGKDRARRNALKHGLRAKELIIKDDQQEDFQVFHDTLQSTVMPDDPVEWILFNDLVRSAWNLRRINQLEADLFDGSTDPLADEQLDTRMDRLARYRAANERTFYRALRELKALQTASIPLATYKSVNDQQLPSLVDIAKVHKRTQEILRDACRPSFEVPSKAERDAIWSKITAEHGLGGPQAV